MKVVFAGGGTGGHIFPGIAVARSIMRLDDGIEVEFWGSGRPLEADLFRREEMPFRTLPCAPLPSSPLRVPGFLYATAAGYLKSKKMLRKAGVGAVVGLGGYSSFAPVFAASRLGLPTVLLEQNAIPGFANRRLARRASVVCLSWEASAGHLPARASIEVTGNPLRLELVEAARRRRYDVGGSVLVLGGSSGAVGLNTMVTGAIEGLRRIGRPIVHQTGSADAERVAAAYRTAGVGASVLPFIDDMAAAYSRSALVIARAGGTTLSEIALFGLPSILVPYPHHKDRHQRANAEICAPPGAARIIEEEEGSGVLAAALGDIFDATARLEGMHAAALALGAAEAADVVAGIVIRLSSSASDD